LILSKIIVKTTKIKAAETNLLFCGPELKLNKKFCFQSSVAKAQRTKNTTDLNVLKSFGWNVFTYMKIITEKVKF